MATGTTRPATSPAEFRTASARPRLPVGARVLGLVLLLNSSATAQTCHDYRAALRPAGGVYVNGGEDVAVSGSYAYLAAGGGGLVVFDITDPAAPQVVGNWPTASLSNGVAVAGNYAYVADWGAGLQIIDITDPTAPTLAGHVDTPGQAYGVAVDGNYVYVADGTAGVQVVDTFFDPPYATIVGSADTPGTAYSLAVRGNVLYVADDTSVQILDVSVHTLPHVVAFYDTPAAGDRVRDVVISDGIMYLAYGATGLQILDLVYPGSPYLLSTAPTPAAATSVTLEGDRAYVACGSRGLLAFDVSNLGAPLLTGAINRPPNAASSVAALGEFAFVVDHGWGLAAVDATTPVSVPPLGHASNTAATRIAVAGTLAYVVSGPSFAVVDISNDAAPVRIGSTPLPAWGHDIALFGSLAIVAAGDAGVLLVNASTPSSPTVVLTIDTAGTAASVALSGSHLFIADWPSGLRVIDLFDPSAPLVTLPLWGAVEVRVSGSHAYVVSEFAISAVDITNPASPVEVGFASVPYKNYLAFSGSLLFAAGGSTDLSVLDIANPASPTLIGSVAVPGGATDVTVSGDLVYTASYGQGMQIIDASNPTAPIVIGSNDTPGLAESIAAAGDRIYLADNGADGFSVYAPQCAVPTAVFESPPRVTRLLAPFPNPANPRVTIPFLLAHDDDVQMTIVDVAGREVARLLDGPRSSGPGRATWTGSTSRGEVAASGLYFVRLVTGDGVHTAKIVLMK